MNKSIRFSQILTLFNLFFMLLFIFSYLLIDSHPYMNWASIFLITSILIVNIFILNIGSNKLIVLRNLTVIIILVWFKQRLLFLLFFPDDIRFSSFIDYSFYITNTTLIYILLSLLFVFGAFLSVRVDRLFQLKKNYEKSMLSKISYKSIFIISSIPLFFAVYLSLVYDQGTYYGSVPKVLAILNMLLNKDIFIMIFVLYSVHNWHILRNKSLFFIYLLLVIISATVVGGKGGIYTVAIVFLYSIFIVYGDFKIKLSNLFKANFYLIIIIPVALFLFSIGDGVRYAKFAKSNADMTLVELIEVAPTYSNYTNINEQLTAISRRFSHYDYMPIIIHNTDNYVRDVVNLGGNVKIILNLLLPGTPYIGERYSLELFKVAYLGVPLSDVIDVDVGQTHGDHWPIFGIVWVLFNPFISLIAIFIIFKVISYCYLRFVELDSKYGLVWSSVTIFTINASISDAFGIDHIFQKLIIYTCSSLFYILILNILYRFSKIRLIS